MALRTPAVALALTAVVATTLVVGVATRAHGQAESFAGVAHSAAEADHRARAMLDRAYLLGAVRVDPPSTYRADHPHQYEVQDERWLSLNGTPSEVADGLLAHPPAGFEVSRASELTRSPDAVGTELRPTGQGTSLLHLLEVTATKAGTGQVLVLLQAIVAWVPPRTTAESLSPDVLTGDLSSGFGDSPDGARLRHRTLSTAEVRALAATLNARPTVSPYSGNACPAGNLGLAILTVPYRNGLALYQIDIGVCGQVQVQVDGVTQPNLAGGAALSSQIADLLGATPDSA
jgi:hypothetical protein